MTGYARQRAKRYGAAWLKAFLEYVSPVKECGTCAGVDEHLFHRLDAISRMHAAETAHERQAA
jgi:hypothetical protein